jgi:hypothetical protein
MGVDVTSQVTNRPRDNASAEAARHGGSPIQARLKNV